MTAWFPVHPLTDVDQFVSFAKVWTERNRSSMPSRALQEWLNLLDTAGQSLATLARSCSPGDVAQTWATLADATRRLASDAPEFLLAEARRAGVRRFIYVGAFAGDGWSHTAYVRAHETFAADLAQSGIPHAVVRATGLFSVFGELLDTARRGPLPVVGGGASKTNPIHDDDVAALCVTAIQSNDPALAIDCGGPDVVTRRQINEQCFAALGRRPRMLPVPAFVMRFSARLLGILNPRLGQLFAFATAVATNDCVAPARGERHLADYLRERVALPPGGAPSLPATGSA